MAIILPKEGNIWETLGGSIGSGLGALAQGKIQQMQKRNYAGSLQQMGLSPDIAYLPEKLQPLAIKQHYKGIEALGKQQQDEALFQQGVNLGGDPDMLRQAYAAGNLKGVVNKLTNTEYLSPAQRAGVTSSKTNQFRLSPEKQKVNQLAQELSGSSGIQALQQNSQLSNPQQNQSTAQSQGLQQTQSNVLKNQDFTPQEQILMQSLEDPNIPAEKKQEIRETLQAAKGRDWGYGIGALAGSIGNFASNAASTIGGWPSQLESVLAPVAKKAFAPIVRSEIEDLKKSAKGLDKNSKEYIKAQERIGLLQKDLDAPITYSTPTSTEIKEDFVRPFAKALGVEKHIDPKNPLETFFGRLGGVAPALAVSSLLSGGSVAADLLRQSKIAGLAEGAGQLTEAITGSKLAGNVASLFGYVLPGIIKPGFFSKIIDDAYETTQNLFKGRDYTRINSSGLMQELQPIRDAVTADPTSSGYQFLAKKLKAIENAVNEVTNKADPKKLFYIDKSFGKQYEEAQKLGVSKEFQQMEEAVRNTYQKWVASVDPKAAQGLISAQAAEASLRSNSIIEKTLQTAGDTRVPLLSQPGYALKVAARLLKLPAKTVKLFITEPIMREAMLDVLKNAADDNKAGLYTSGQKLYDALIKHAPSLIK